MEIQIRKEGKRKRTVTIKKMLVIKLKSRKQRKWKDYKDKSIKRKEKGEKDKEECTTNNNNYDNNICNNSRIRGIL